VQDHVGASSTIEADNGWVAEVALEVDGRVVEALFGLTVAVVIHVVADDLLSPRVHRLFVVVAVGVVEDVVIRYGVFTCFDAVVFGISVLVTVFIGEVQILGEALVDDIVAVVIDAVADFIGAVAPVKARIDVIVFVVAVAIGDAHTVAVCIRILGVRASIRIRIRIGIGIGIRIRIRIGVTTERWRSVVAAFIVKLRGAACDEQGCEECKSLGLHENLRAL